MSILHFIEFNFFTAFPFKGGMGCIFILGGAAGGMNGSLENAVFNVGGAHVTAVTRAATSSAKE